MTNQASLPTLLLPTVPADWCPQGNAPAVFNDYQTQFLSQAVVNIPGIENVNPATIAEMQAQIVVLQNQVTALQKFSRNGTQAVSSGNSTVAIAFTPVTSLLYDIFITPIGTGTETDPAWSWDYVTASRSLAGFSIRFVEVPSTITTFEWSIRER